MDAAGHRSINDTTAVFAVADGMGGPGGGEIASHLAIDCALRTFEEYCGTSLIEAVRRAFLEAHRGIIEAAQNRPELSDMGTTLVVVGVEGDRMCIGSIGDSRAVLFRGDFCRRLTRDHLMIVELQGVPENKAKGRPQDNVLTRALDPQGAAEPDILNAEVQGGDRLVLFSDGVTGHVYEPEMSEIVFSRRPTVAADEIVTMAVSAGSSDHCTALVVAILDDGAVAT